MAGVSYGVWVLPHDHCHWVQLTVVLPENVMLKSVKLIERLRSLVVWQWLISHYEI